jgi:stage III sporulation protein AG
MGRAGVVGWISSKKNKGTLMIILGLLIGVSLLMIGNGGKESQDISDSDQRMEKYAECVEKKIMDMCLTVEGVSDVSVAVSFKSGFEYVYAQNGENGEILVIGNGSSEKVVTVTEKPPLIGGIGIVCVGGGDIHIQSELINLISAAFGVNSNKIYITEAKN